MLCNSVGGVYEYRALADCPVHATSIQWVGGEVWPLSPGVCEKPGIMSAEPRQVKLIMMVIVMRHHYVWNFCEVGDLRRILCMHTTSSNLFWSPYNFLEPLRVNIVLCVLLRDGGRVSNGAYSSCHCRTYKRHTPSWHQRNSCHPQLVAMLFYAWRPHHISSYKRTCIGEVHAHKCVHSSEY